MLCSVSQRYNPKAIHNLAQEVARTRKVSQRYNPKAIHNYQEFIFSERRFRLLSKNAGWMNPHLLSFVSPNEMTSKKSGVFCG